MFKKNLQIICFENECNCLLAVIFKTAAKIAAGDLERRQSFVTYPKQTRMDGWRVKL